MVVGGFDFGGGKGNVSSTVAPPSHNWALFPALYLLMLSGAVSRAEADSTLGGFVPRQVIIKLGTTGATVEDINATYGSTSLETFPGSSDVYLLKLPAGSAVTETVEQRASDARLLYAEPNFVAQSPEGDAWHRARGVGDVVASLAPGVCS